MAAAVASWRAERYAEHMGSERPADRPLLDDGAERAARVKAMLARWQTEAVGDAPEWDVEDIAPLHLEQKPTSDNGA